MGRVRNPDCHVEMSSPEAEAARAFGIDLDKAMVVCRARTYSAGCQEMTHVVIAKDEDTYDFIAGQGEEIGLPIPVDMLVEARETGTARDRARSGHAPLSNQGGTVSGVFSACCTRSRDVTVIIVGQPPDPRDTKLRYLVSCNRNVEAKVDPANPIPHEQKITDILVHSGRLVTCRDQGQIDPKDARA